MANDPLNNEVSVGVSLEDSGLKAKAKSRAIAGIDRLLGNLADWINPALERQPAIRRAKTEAELRIIEAATDAAINRIGVDPEFAQRAIDNHLAGVVRGQQNKDAVANQAFEQLKLLPPSDSQAEEGNDELDEAFMSRFESYAATASSDELRERWGRVLASEVRQPGTFSPRVMRVVDELSSSTAEIFEDLCSFRIGQAIPKCVMPELAYNKRVNLVEAGLLVEPGLGQNINLLPGVTNSDGQEFWFLSGEDLGVAISSDIKLDSYKGDRILGLRQSKEFLTVPIYLLTEVGISISSILPDNRCNALEMFANWIIENYDVDIVKILEKKSEEPKQWVDIKSIKDKS